MEDMIYTNDEVMMQCIVVQWLEAVIEWTCRPCYLSLSVYVQIVDLAASGSEVYLVEYLQKVYERMCRWTSSKRFRKILYIVTDVPAGGN